MHQCSFVGRGSGGPRHLLLLHTSRRDKLCAASVSIPKCSISFQLVREENSRCGDYHHSGNHTSVRIGLNSGALPCLYSVTALQAVRVAPAVSRDDRGPSEDPMLIVVGEVSGTASAVSWCRTCIFRIDWHSVLCGATARADHCVQFFFLRAFTQSSFSP